MKNVRRFLHVTSFTVTCHNARRGPLQPSSKKRKKGQNFRTLDLKECKLLPELN